MMLEIRNASLRIGQRVLIQPFSLVVAQGETVTLMGPSGCGKSSLLSLIGGTLPEALTGDGKVLLDGVDLNGMPPEARKLGRLFQDDLLFPHMTVAENLMFGMVAGPRAARQQEAAQALTQIGLPGFGARAPHTLSGGERARVALMRALLAKPAGLLLDEPFSKLDQELRVAMRNLTFSQIRMRDIPALLVTHDAADAPPGGRVLQVTAGGLIRDA